MNRKILWAAVICLGSAPLAGMAADYGGSSGTGSTTESAPSSSGGAMGSPGSSRDAGSATGSGSMGSPGSSHDTTTGTTGSAGSASGSMAGQDVPALFKQLDRNRDGQISKSEARRSADTQSRFDSLDSDSNGRLSLQEWMTGQAGAAGSPGAERDMMNR